MNYPKLNLRKPSEKDLNWINLHPDHNGSFGIQFYRSEFPNWTNQELKIFFSYFGTVSSVYIDKNEKYVYVRFLEKKEAYSAMICLKRICIANPALNQIPIYVQIMNANFNADDLMKIFEPFSPAKIVPHRTLDCVYIVYLYSTLSANSILKKYPRGEHPFIVSLTDPLVREPLLKNHRLDQNGGNEFIYDLIVNLAENGTRSITKTKNVIPLPQQDSEMNFPPIEDNKYIKHETLKNIYKDCFNLSLEEVMGNLQTNDSIQILCKEKFREGVWGIVLSEGLNRIAQNQKLLKSTLHFLEELHVLEEFKGGSGRCGAILDGELYRAFLMNKEEMSVFLVDEGVVGVAETLWLLPEHIWKDQPATLLRPFVVGDFGMWRKLKRDEVVEVRVGQCLSPPQNHIFIVFG